ncbi:FAD-dependent monooxygenase [Actinophytocola sp.]|uniref:FAD-dependent monooxygenase n=1 Tax=Actinophytocola sp. TaxID=1872138 RepID=UPI002D80BF99|nr:FAD-dependent monooxygenase [Actinophytocola sp.]HET9137917.1 FAD-dependent monooxygenase [Actinophytocola sp.]
MTSRTVLISGAGIAGPTLAYWLGRHGFAPTVVERAAAPRSSGSPVDVRGPAVAVAQRMGVLPDIRRAGTEVTELTFVNAAGRRAGRINIRALRRATGSGEVELPRGDLATILQRVAREHAEFVYGDRITALHQDERGVDVTFEHAAPRRFDLVVGADGLHSAVRALAFGPEREFVEHLGIYVATAPLPGTENPHAVVLHNVPGRLVAVHPSTGGALAFFAFRGPELAGFDPNDTASHKRILTGAFAGGGWRVPELLDRMQAAADLYFDSVSRVNLRPWSRGRVALLGDAASCVSLFGDGSTLAMTGAATLADALAAHPDDHVQAFRRFEAEHRVRVDPKLHGIERASTLLIPATRTGIVTRNLLANLWPLGAAAGWLTRTAARSSRHDYANVEHGYANAGHG